jgi:hypothetical protein
MFKSLPVNGDNMNKIQKEFSYNKSEEKGSVLLHVAAWFVCAVTQALPVLLKIIATIL